jgi:hypothetical protein
MYCGISPVGAGDLGRVENLQSFVTDTELTFKLAARRLTYLPIACCLMTALYKQIVLHLI